MLSTLRRNSFILSLLGLAFLCFALAEARADTKGIPYNEQFASALFPYARTVSGCTDWRRPERLEDTWGRVSFADACAEHDRCFHRPGASWADCNQRYKQDLQAACNRDLSRARLEQGTAATSGQPDPEALTLCYEITNLYIAKAQGPDIAKRFALAQEQARRYIAYVRSVVSQVYRSVLKREATSKEETQALTALLDDYTLDDLKAALMGQRLDLAERKGEGLDLPGSDLPEHGAEDQTYDMVPEVASEMVADRAPAGVPTSQDSLTLVQTAAASD